MGGIIQLVPKSELERLRLIREARAIYDSIFPPASSAYNQTVAPRAARYRAYQIWSLSGNPRSKANDDLSGSWKDF